MNTTLSKQLSAKLVIVALLLSSNMTIMAQKKAPKTMKQNAKEIVADIGIGWNLGNTFEAYNFGTTDSETSWGNARTTKEMIDSIAAYGFKAVRIPVRWYPHFTYDDNTLTIDPSWLARIKEVVDYCIDNNLYVIINSHHEMWLEGHPTYADSADIYKRFRLLWTEIANYFNDYDEHLLFAGTNEVHVGNNWGRPTDENADVQNGYNQQFINAVRATNGNNAWRNLIVQTYACNGAFGLELFKKPTDKVKDRMIVEIHNYDPSDYGLNDRIRYWGKPYVSFGTNSENDEQNLTDTYEKVYKTFAKLEVPFIVGEMGTNYHTYKDETDREVVDRSAAYYYEYVFKTIRANGGAPFIWDNGVVNRRGRECFGLFDRRDHMKCTQPLVLSVIGLENKMHYK